MLGFAKRAAPATYLGPGVFGKVATAGDFVSSGEYSPAAAHLSRWLEQGVGWAATQAKAAWEAVDYSAPRAFLFRPERSDPGDRVIFGLLQPSRDSVGRHFPIAVFGELTLGSDLDAFPVLPLAVGDFLEGAASVLTQTEHGGDPRRLIQQLPPPTSHHLARAREEYQQWAATARISTALGSIFLDGWESRGPNTLSSLYEIIGPFIGREYPDTPLSLRLPLGNAGIAGVVFWLEFMRRASRWKRTVPVCFWHAYSDSGQVVIPLGDPSARALLGLWAANDLDDSHCDLTAVAQTYGQLPKPVQVALANDTTVAELMAVL